MSDYERKAERIFRLLMTRGETISASKIAAILREEFPEREGVWMKQVAPVVRKALCAAINNLPQLDMGTAYDEDVRIECRQALEAMNRMGNALAADPAPDVAALREALTEIVELIGDHSGAPWTRDINRIALAALLRSEPKEG